MSVILRSCLLLVAVPAGLQAQSAAMQRIEMAAEYKLHICVSPNATPPCVCTKPADRARKCPGCQQWREEPLLTSVSAKLGTNDYAYSGGAPRANVFASDVAKELWGESFPTTEAGFPLTAADFYKSYDRYGWLEVSASANKVGTLVAFENMVGVVVADENGELVVLYPSHQRDGALNRTRLKYLGAPAAAKFLVPRDFLAKAAASIERNQ